MDRWKEAESVILEYESGTISAQLDRTQKVLVRDVSFSLRAGESLVLIGETGSGKTMAALSLMKLLPSNVRMNGGTIRFLGEDLLKRKNIRALLGQDIVYIPQSGLECLNPSETVRRQMYSNLRKLNTPIARLEHETLEHLSAAGFPEPEAVVGRYPFQLSGGMAQRVTIALALCSNAKLIIADEPTNGLGEKATAVFGSLLDSLFPEAAKLVITHDIGVAGLCANTLVMCGGRMMERGPSSALLAEPRHPYTKALIGALVRNGMRETPALREGRGDCPFYRRCPDARPECLTERGYRTDGDREWWCRQT